MIVYLQDLWREFGDADNIVAHALKTPGLQLEIKTRQELMDMNTREFLDGIYFCDTDIVQHHIKKANGPDFLVPDTYDQSYREHFHREIEKMTFKEYSEKYSGTLRFIKPVGNNKFFSGHVLWEPSEVQSFEPLPPDYPIYVCEPVTFQSESRLLIGNGQLYGSAPMSVTPDYSYDDGKFLESLIEITGTRFCCVDIGSMRRNPTTKKWQWVVTEINPPFAFGDYGMPFSDYFSFCADACQYIRKNIL